MPLGIVVGVRVADPGVSLVGTSLSLETTFIPAGTRSNVRYLYIVDDPFVLFEAQFDATGATQAQMSMNAAVTITANQTSLSPSVPFSTLVLTGPAVTATLPIRMLGAVQRIDNQLTGTTASPYVRVLCKWNYHEFGAVSGSSAAVVSYLAV